MLRLVDLANRSDFSVGSLRVSPARRSLVGPGGSAAVEPIVMKVLLLLFDAAGNVVTREELFANAWGGVFVGDDSLNRAVARARKTLADVAPGEFEIETIPRTGYRLTGAGLTMVDLPTDQASQAANFHVSRRTLVGAGAAVASAALVGGAASWRLMGPRTDPNFLRLMVHGEDALRLDQPASTYFRKAAAIDPGSARAWGLLAYSLANSSPALSGSTAQAAERTARKALSINSNESNGLLALALIQSDAIDWFERERRFRDILAIDPSNTRAMRSLGQLLHGVGRCREALAVVEHAMALEPLAPDHWARKAGRLWVLGRTSEADQVIDRALQYWPLHPLVRLLRLMIYAYTGRARAALALVDEEAKNPTFFASGAVAVWRTSLLAIETPNPRTIGAARAANVEGSRGSPQIAAWAILTLSALSELDAAFEVANGFLLDRGSIIVRPRPHPGLAANMSGWRNTFGLFTPPARSMRLDPRFKQLADGLGLTDYWHRRGIGPDAFLFKR